MRLWFVCLLLGSLGYGQASPSAPPAARGAKAEQSVSAPPDKAPEKTVRPDDTVLTVKGVCADSSKQGDDCKTTLTRAQFDKLADALQPNMPPAIRRQLANVYSRMLLMTAAAEKRGLDKQPKFDETMRFARMQILSQEFSRALQEDANKLTDQDFGEYYGKNAANFEQAEFLRVFVPLTKQIDNPKPDMKDSEVQAQRKAGEAELDKVAAELRARAAQGEDFDKLEKEAFAAAGLKGTPPDPKMSKVRRTSLPPKHGVVLDLKPGEVSQLISDPSGHYFYKMVSKETLPLDSVKEEIRNTLSAQRYRDSMKPYQNSDNAELNDAYFAPAPKAPAPPPVRGTKPEDEGENDPN